MRLFETLSVHACVYERDGENKEIDKKVNE
jgi:hypothetical protein